MSGAGSSTTVSLLGPVTVRHGEVALPIGGDIPRAIVARLALSAGTVVATETLVADIWAEPSDRIVVSLRAHISRLRQGALGDIVEGGRQGYRLLLDPDAVDAVRFSAVVGAADDPSRAIADRIHDLDVALGWWRGRPLADLPDVPFVEDARARLLEEQRLAALALARLRLDAGDAAAARLDLERLTAERPLDEAPTLLLATALARGGRTSDALAALDAYGERLLDQQGLDVPADVRALRADIVRQDPRVLGLTAEAAPVRSNVPIPLTPIVGRAVELEQLAQARGVSRLVTLVGPAGVGKTRLLIEHARQSGAVDEEHYLADLTTTEPGGVAALVAGLVGAASATAAAIATRLEGRRVLLMLDNAEHVLAETRGLVTELLAATERLTAVATSREPLGIAGERLLRVAPFDGDRLPDAVAVFTQRAQDVDDTFELTESTADLVAEVCRLLDGIPLAVELAASRLDVLPLSALLASLPTGTGLGAGRGRHASLGNAIEWSTALLSDSERSLLDQLARFAGPFTLDSVEGICDTGSEPVVVVMLELVRKSLVAVSGDDAGDRRYRLLRAIRQHVRDTDDSDAGAWFDRHARWMAGFAASTAERLSSPDARAAQADLDATRADLRLALDTAVRTGERRLALELFITLASYWYRRGQVDEALDAAERADAVEGDTDPSLEARFRRGRALIAYRAGNGADITRYTVEAAELARESGDAPLEAVALANYAYTSTLFGDAEQGREMMRRSLELADSAPPAIRSEIELCHGQLLRAIGRPQDALRALARAQHLASANGPGWIQAFAPYMTAKVLLDLRRGRDAIAVLKPGLASALATDDPTSALIMLHAIAASTAYIERHEVGARLLGMIDATGTRYGYDTASSEGPDAEDQRRRVREGLTDAAFERAYRAGRTLGFAEARELVESLPS
ncbi:putative ATPase [Diaminobutyricimonas aerilata]|uniref:Putative ATPase n=1 Tax=Diaminobutyricimonas aerilata TaxID=1162967 RepID=A0A2M9CLZ9_9MICO|nr:BTAD domain-containing putative transcriptional regulator [Diaminobutyricimonas aerilata]PJJ72916.1 putative ATPase [Diaminobutyricimonas aerilata]